MGGRPQRSRVPAPLPADDPRAVLAAAGRAFDVRGWVMGTVGNLSARLADGSVLITATGRPKGALTPRDFVRLDPSGAVLERPDAGTHPSREADLHRAVYRLVPAAHFCYHVHSVEAAVAADLARGDNLTLPAHETLKILGVWHEAPRVRLAVLPNHLDVARLAGAIERRFRRVPPAVPALLVRRHGLTAWGETAEAARAHLEAAEFLLRYVVEVRRLGGRP
jgi:methylthioribulose-1-phosphate dehydratase